MSKPKVNAGAVFERREKKYRLPSEKCEDLIHALHPYFRCDQYGLHTICSIYYDTDDYALARHSLDSPKYKQKLRLRSYGVPRCNDKVYLELKKKFDGVTYKRRIGLSLREAEDYLHRGVIPQNPGANFGEIDWFFHQQDLSPKLMISYDRVALYGLENPELRVTFDGQIRWRDHSLSLSNGDYGASLLEAGAAIMEIKTLDALPYWLSGLLSEHRVYPSSFSKYGAVYREHLRGQKELRHAG